MTEYNNENGSEPSVDIDPGALLRQARESAGMSIDDVAQKLYLKASAVEKIESNELDDAKSVTFTKGYVKNYAKLVGVDVDTVVALFDQFHNRPQDAAKLQSFSKRVAKQAHDDRWMMVTYLILLVILGGVVWWWLQQPNSSVGESVGNPSTNSPGLVNSDDAPASKPQESIVQDKTVPATTSLPDAISSDVVSNDAISNNSADDTPDIEPEIEPAIANAVDGNNTASQLNEQAGDDEPAAPIVTEAASLVSVVFTFSEDCWVNIVDGTGEAIAYGVKAAGRVMEIEGVPPFEITLGQPQAVSIVYDGETVDMSQFTGNQIARMILPEQD